MKIIVLAARPNFMKAAPITTVIKRHNDAILALSADQQQGLPAGREGT